MSQIKTLNGVQYTLPQYNDTGWGANTGNVLTQYIAAIADVTLQLTGGAFTLTADVNFGASFGVVSSYFTSRTASAASAGAVRLAKTDVVSWRNNAGGGNIDLSKDTSDNLKWNATKILLSGAVVNADINAAAAIAYSKLALTGSILNADLAGSIAYSKLVLTGSIVNADITAGTLTNAAINASAAIAYSKLALTGSIVNADLVAGTLTNAAINASAAIALSKLAALGTAKAVQTNSSTGFLEASSVTNTELGYVSGVTSAIQTQINAITSKYFQTVFATGTSSTSLTSATFTATVVTGSITPSSSSHRVKITATFMVYVPIAAGSGEFYFARGSTKLGSSGAGSGMAQQGDTGAGVSFTTGVVTLTWIDSPSTTSAQGYTVYGSNANAAGTITIGNGRDWSMTLEEIV